MDMHGYAYFVEHPRRIDDLILPHSFEKERPFRVVAEVQLTAIDYENFVTDMLADRQFIEDHGQPCKRSDVWECLFVRRKGKADGVLVIPQDGCYVGWAAYFCKA